jgi:heat-inducible transcriptional repressor
MLDERKTAILKAVVEEYIATAQPVGSTHVANAAGVKVSSATVRNEMAVLEQEGYLAQPHTSAGRIPTDKGYRFFVDHMAPPGRLDRVASEQVGQFFDTAHGRLEELLHRTTNLLAQVTHHAARGRPCGESASVRSVQVVGLGGRHATVVAVMSNGVVESETVELPADTSDVRLAAVSAHLQQHLGGRSLEQVATVPATGDRELDAVCDAATSALGAASVDEPVFVGGAASMAQAFDTVETVRSVLHTLEQQYVLVSLVRDVMHRGLSVAIGAEHGVEPLAACSVVVRPIVVDGEHVGTVGVLGPTRMDYPQALATVEAVSNRLGRRLGDGGVNG